MTLHQLMIHSIWSLSMYSIYYTWYDLEYK
jgi:hypothetical protein